MNKIKRIILSVATISIVSYLIFQYLIPQSFASNILSCSTSDAKERFSCYRFTIERFYGQKTDEISDYLKNNTKFSFDANFRKSNVISYAIFGTNCHTFYHAIGDFIAEHSKSNNVKELLDKIPPHCTSGGVMGLYKRLALKNDFNQKILSDFFQFCRKGEEHQCAHEIGHILHDKYSYSILKILDGITKAKYNLSTKDYKYTLSEKPNLEAPFDECRAILPEKEWQYCFTGIGHNLFLFSQFNDNKYDDSINECKAIKDKENCLEFLVYRIGINDVAPKAISESPEKAMEVCDKIIQQIAEKNLESHCYLGMGGGLGLFIDSEYAYRDFDEESFINIRNEILAIANICSKVKDDYVKNCYAGMMGTKFAKLYKLFGIYNEEIEKLIPLLGDFQVVG